MIDFSQLLSGPAAAAGALPASGVAAEGDGAAFDAVLGDVLGQLAALLVPANPAPMLATSAGLPGFGGVTVPDPANANEPSVGQPEGQAVALPAPTTAAPMTIPTFVAVGAATRPPLPATTKQGLLAEAAVDPLVSRDGDAPTGDEPPTAVVDLAPGPADALIAAVRAGLGLSAAAVTASTHPGTPAIAAATTMPDRAVAAGRTGVMPTLPDQAVAVLPAPAGLTRRFPDPASTAPPTATGQGAEAGPHAAAPAAGMAQEGPAPIVMSTVTPDVAPAVVVPSQPDPASEPVNDIAVPDAPVTGIPVTDESPADAPVPTPKLAHAVPENLDRLNAVAPPRISSAEDAADSKDTTSRTDTLRADTPRADDAPFAATAAAVSSTHATRADHTERVHEANGLAAPLRAAMRERANPKRDDSFELTVRLDPPELGAVRVRVMTQGDNVKITLHADSPEARAVLQERHDDLKTILRNEGFNLDGFDVESDDQRHQSPEHSNRRRTPTVAPTLDEPADDGALRL